MDEWRCLSLVNNFDDMLTHLLKILRIPNLLIIILTQYFVRHFLIKPVMCMNGGQLSLAEFDFFILVLATLMITAAGYIINDYFDLEIDKINKPEKIILGTKISIATGRFLYIMLNVLGVGLGFWLSYKVNNLQLGFIFLLIAFILWYYSARYKRMPLAGNMVVATLSAFVIFIVWLFEFFALKMHFKMHPELFIEQLRSITLVNIFVLAYTFFAFLLSFIREIIKDAEDVQGDAQFACRTFPCMFGVKKSKILIAALILFTVLMLAYGQYHVWKLNLDYLFWYSLLIIQPLFAYLLIRLVKAKSKEEFHWLSTVSKITMLAGILSIQLIQLHF